jgi:uncharacterized protein
MQRATNPEKPPSSFLAPLRQGHDLLDEVMRIIQEHGIEHAAISIIGAVCSATFGYYDQEAKEYMKIIRDGRFEVLSCTGNVTLKQGSTFTHAHVLFGDRSGAVFGGHLMSPSIVFAAELHILELAGLPPERMLDAATGLYLLPAGKTATEI